MLTLKGHTSPVQSLCFSPDGRWITSTAGSQALLWEPTVSTEPSVVTPPGEDRANSFAEAAFGPRGDRLWLILHDRGQRDKRQPIYGYRSPSDPDTFVMCEHKGLLPELLAPSLDGEKLLLGARIADRPGYTTGRVIDGGTDGSFSESFGQLGYMIPGRRAFMTGNSEYVLFGGVEFSWGRLKTHTNHSPNRYWIGHPSGFRGVTFLLNGSLLTAGPNVMHLQRPPKVSVLRAIPKIGTPFITSLAASPTGNCLAVGRNGGLVNILDPESFTEIATFRWPIGNVTCLAFAPDGLRCAAGGQKGHLIVWDLE